MKFMLKWGIATWFLEMATRTITTKIEVLVTQRDDFAPRDKYSTFIKTWRWMQSFDENTEFWAEWLKSQ